MINILIFSLELLLCIGVFYFAKKYFKNTMGKLSTAVLVVILTTVLFLVNSWVQETPVIYDKVRVEALNEKSDSSMGVEVSINGMKTSIGQQFFPEVVEGKCFFTTESNYMWRPEYDLRQPKGTTREIVLNVPVGKDRILLFKKSEWGGKAVVKCCGGKSLIDTNLEAQVNLTDSSFKRRLFQAACKIALFGLIVGAFVALLYVLVRIYQSDDKKLKNKSTYFLIAITFILLVSPHLHTQEFWLDEMFQIFSERLEESFEDEE